MEQQGRGVISQNDLMKKLVSAKKVMNTLDGGSFERGKIDESMYIHDANDYITEEETINQRQTPNSEIEMSLQQKVNNTRLPENIKRAMIENPIQQISLNDTLDMGFLEGAKKLMEREGLSKKSPTPQRQITESKYIQPPTSNFDMSAIALLIENTVRKVMDEKLNQILTAHSTSTINENLVLKVGDSVFKGKITGVTKAK